MQVQVPNAGIGTAIRFPLGSYVQIDGEIMRVTTSELSGSGLNEVGVVRGALGSTKQIIHLVHLLEKLHQYQLNLEDHQSFVHQVIRLNILVMVLVTIQLVYHRFKLKHLLKEKSS